MQPWTNCLTALFQYTTNSTSLSYSEEQMRWYMQSGQKSDQKSMEVELKNMGTCQHRETQRNMTTKCDAV